ncbi:helix-turn-helix domain-containing protein [Bordetella bronchialis]|uniref:helix-turn-helix domain-containing protein n=1 Tax=Bordetella bronchialis TaxID=463025 RepID=UPI000AB017E0|nr:XRE family transcriptional regulator [Bordetella bronchialis]
MARAGKMPSARAGKTRGGIEAAGKRAAGEGPRAAARLAAVTAAARVQVPDTPTAANPLSRKLRRLRREGQLTLQQLSARCGISVSTLSKIENGQLSPTYEKIAALAQGLDVQVGELFNDEPPAAPTARRSVTRHGQGLVHATAQYDYEVLCAELAHKQFVPLLTTIKARSLQAFPAMLRHAGEEFIYVLEGRVTVHTDHYQPMELAAGDACYFDSTMAHACVAGDTDARVLWVCSNPVLPRADA